MHNYLTNIHEAQDEVAVALGHAQRALALYRAAGDRRGQGRQLNAVGWLNGLLGEHEQALSHGRAALALQSETGDWFGAALTWNSLGRDHRHLDDPQEAISCYRRVLELIEGPEATDPLNAAETLTSLGDAQESAGAAADARQSWQRALQILENLRHPYSRQPVLA